MSEEPTQTTPKGLEIPVPKRKDVIDNLKKSARPKPAREHSDDDIDKTVNGALAPDPDLDA